MFGVLTLLQVSEVKSFLLSCALFLVFQLYAGLIPGSTSVLYGFLFGQLGAISFLAWKAKSGCVSLLYKLYD